MWGGASRAKRGLSFGLPTGRITPGRKAREPVPTIRRRITLMNKPPVLNSVNAVVFLSRAKVYLQRKQFERALADLAEALRLNPQLGEAWMVRATVRVEMGDYRQALADVERRLQIA